MGWHGLGLATHRETTHPPLKAPMGFLTGMFCASCSLVGEVRNDLDRKGDGALMLRLAAVSLGRNPRDAIERRMQVRGRGSGQGPAQTQENATGWSSDCDEYSGCE